MRFIYLFILTDGFVSPGLFREDGGAKGVDFFETTAIKVPKTLGIASPSVSEYLITLFLIARAPPSQSRLEWEHSSFGKYTIRGLVGSAGVGPNRGELKKRHKFKKKKKSHKWYWLFLSPRAPTPPMSVESPAPQGPRQQRRMEKLFEFGGSQILDYIKLLK